MWKSVRENWLAEKTKDGKFRTGFKFKKQGNGQEWSIGVLSAERKAQLMAWVDVETEKVETRQAVVRSLCDHVRTKLDEMSREVPYAKVLLLLREDEFDRVAEGVYQKAKAMTGDTSVDSLSERLRTYQQEHKDALCRKAVLAYEKQFRMELLNAARERGIISAGDVQQALQGREYYRIADDAGKREIEEGYRARLERGLESGSQLRENFKVKVAQQGCVLLHIDDLPKQMGVQQCLELVRAHQSRFPWLGAIAVRDDATNVLCGVHVLQNVLVEKESTIVELLLKTPIALGFDKKRAIVQPDSPDPGPRKKIAHNPMSHGHPGIDSNVLSDLLTKLPRGEGLGELLERPPDPLPSQTIPVAQRGICTKWFAAFYKRLIDAGFEEQKGQKTHKVRKTREFVEQVAAPFAEAFSARLFDLVPDAYRGVPTVFVSHAWDDYFGKLCRALSHGNDCANDGSFLWMDLFAIAQQQSDAQREDASAIATTVAEIGNTRLVVDLYGPSSAKDPRGLTPLARSWCMYEIAHTPSDGLDVIVPEGVAGLTPKQKEAAMKWCREELSCESAQALRPDDKTHIDELMLQKFKSWKEADDTLRDLVLERLARIADHPGNKRHSAATSTGESSPDLTSGVGKRARRSPVPGAAATADVAIPSFRAGDILQRARAPYLKIKLLDDQQEGGGRLEGRFEALTDDTVDVGDVAQVRFDAGVQYSVRAVAEDLKAQGVLNFHFLNRNNFSPV